MSIDVKFDDISDFWSKVCGLFHSFVEGRPRAYDEFVTVSNPVRFARVVYKNFPYCALGRGDAIKEDLLSLAWWDFKKMADEESLYGGAILVWRKPAYFEDIDIDGEEGTKMRCRFGLLPVDLSRWVLAGDLGKVRGGADGEVAIASLTGDFLPNVSAERAGKSIDDLRFEAILHA